MSERAFGPAHGPDAAAAHGPDAGPAHGPDAGPADVGGGREAEGGGASGAEGGGASPGATPDSYEAAAARIEEIILRLDSGEGGLRETLELCREGRSLVEFCAGELEAVGRGLEELRLDELVTRLEGGGRTV